MKMYVFTFSRNNGYDQQQAVVLAISLSLSLSLEEAREKLVAELRYQQSGDIRRFDRDNLFHTEEALVASEREGHYVRECDGDIVFTYGIDG